MAVTPKKPSRRAKPKRRQSISKKPFRSTHPIRSLRGELAEALEQQVATSEILRMIAKAPGDLQSLLDTIVERAAKLCDAENAAIFRVDDNVLRIAAQFGRVPMAFPIGGGPVLDRGAVNSRVVLDLQTIHVDDLAAAEAEYPLEKSRGIAMGIRTLLATPLLRDGVAIGTVAIRRTEVRPFTDRQIALLKTFADQAVIAIENARLFNELKVSLEQQTGTSEILGVIARSPAD